MDRGPKLTWQDGEAMSGPREEFPSTGQLAQLCAMSLEFVPRKVF